MAQLLNPCAAPPLGPCQKIPPYPLFTTGLSMRRMQFCDPSTGPPHCECDGASYARLRIGAGGSIDRSNWLEGWIYGQLTTRGEVDCEHSPTGRQEGGWWADAFRQGSGTARRFRTGSKLWALQYSTVTNEALMRARDYATEALEYLVTWGIASRIKVETLWVSKRAMRLTIAVFGPGLATSVMVNGLAQPHGGWVWEKGR